MLLLCDVGNTTTVVGLWDVDHVDRRWRISTDRERTADESRLLLRSMLAEHGGPVTGGALSSVVPPRTEAWREAMGALVDGPLVVVGPGVKTGIALAVDNPREVGADRVANAIGAQRQFGAPVIVVDFGTATTVDLVGPDGSYRGELSPRAWRSRRTLSSPIPRHYVASSSPRPGARLDVPRSRPSRAD